MINNVSEMQSDGGAQCFPLYFFADEAANDKTGLFGPEDQPISKRDAVSDAGLIHFQNVYAKIEDSLVMTKEDIF
jgi:hypothetical protein